MASPIKFAHVVFRTSRYDEMLRWWCTVLEATPRHASDFITFLSYDDEHHRVAIVNFPDLAPANPRSAGVEHIAYTLASLDDLFGNHQRLAGMGITPYWTINHGMTLSAYYRDPDGNQVEFQIDITDLDQADAFMRSDAFAANPIGIDVDFDDLIVRYRSGESFDSVTAYQEAPVAAAGSERADVADARVGSATE
ncbi:unannotated protein [freshwater metagenome]|uniref:Unannotated protein n=1 Tax=freshwater metagenome TaxID=449393 RepID=A0A6J7ES19_9ZZZZ|nr:biphenyl 2,3-dioxygenase [Actinomycetota bacterium]